MQCGPAVRDSLPPQCPAPPTLALAPAADALHRCTAAQSADENYVFHEEIAVHKFEYPLPKLAVLGIMGGARVGWARCAGCAVLQVGNTAPAPAQGER